jgi:hypothetical protein
LIKHYGFKFVAVYYTIYIPTVFFFSLMANQELVTEDNVHFMLSSAGILDEAVVITAENKYEIIAKSAGIGYFIDLDEIEIGPVVGGLVVGYALAQLTEPLRLPLCVAITARLATRV